MNDSSLNSRPNSLWPIAITIMFIALLVAVYFSAQKAADWTPFKSNVTLGTTIYSTVERARATAKLVVYTFDVRAEILKESVKSYDLNLPFGHIKIPAGTTTVTLRSSGNKVQCIVPLSKISSNWFSVDRSAQTVTWKVPRPTIDGTMVEVQTDPRFVEIKTEVGWARLDSVSGEYLREEAKRSVREAVIKEGERRLAADFKDDAERSAERIIQKLFEPFKSQLKNDVSFVVLFE